MSKSERQVMLITGSNRGLGLEITRQALENNFRVIATCRNPDKATKLKELAEKNKDLIQIETLDHQSDETITNLQKKLKDQPIDLLFVNAAVLSMNDFGKLERKGFNRELDINITGALLVSQAFYENVKKSTRKQVIFMSSTLGGIAETPGPFGFDCGFGRTVYYRVSKCGLNMGMAALAHYGKKDNVHVTSLCPGWVKTDMGTSNALLEPKESVGGIYKNIINNYKNIQSGSFNNYAGKTVKW